MESETHTLFDFSDPDAAGGWYNVDDVVMGGVSESQMTERDGFAAFTGHVSLKQGGGFASVRAPEDQHDVGNASAFQVRIRGDDKRYYLTAYTSNVPDISYRAAFQPAGEWNVHTIPFDDLNPRFRGRDVPDAPPFDPSALTQVGFLIADKQAGSFRLDIAWIQAVRQQ